MTTYLLLQFFFFMGTTLAENFSLAFFSLIFFFVYPYACTLTLFIRYVLILSSIPL